MVVEVAVMVVVTDDGDGAQIAAASNPSHREQS